MPSLPITIAMHTIQKHAVVLLYITGSVFFLAGSVLSLWREMRGGR